MDSLRIDPRADLVAPVFDHRAFHARPKSTVTNHDKRVCVMNMAPASFPKRKPCYDWIFSSASNVHVAVDRSAFKTFIPFRTYVLAVADQRQVPAKGIGTVELKIKRQPGIKESHKVVLDNVLYIPSWLCNIISDTHFTPAQNFEHNWSEFGVYFQQKKDDKWKPWGYTEGFCGLERLVLYKDIQGRSPMLEDKDREVFSVNVTWPQHQRDKWTLMVEQEESRLVKEQEREATKKEAKRKAQEKQDTEEKRTVEEQLRAKEEKTADDKKKSETLSDTTESKAEQVDESAKHVHAHDNTMNFTSPSASGLSFRPVVKPLAAADTNTGIKTAVRANSLRVPGKSAFREALPWRKSVDV